MLYHSHIRITGDHASIEKLFSSEDKNLGRASYTLSHDGQGLLFDITAQDATALKIAFNTITKILVVWEKTSALTAEQSP